MLRLDQIELRRGGRPLLERADLTLHPGQKVGVIGPNGCGKSSLFALLRDEVHADSGNLHLPSSWVIAHVRQEIAHTERSALEYVIDGDPVLRQLQNKLSQAEVKNDGHAIAHLHSQIEAIDGYHAETRAAKLLSGLGFPANQHRQAVTTFSGGWRMRLSLAQALMQRSDLLLLDEPTNHLDLDAILWLEQWLQAYDGTLLLISHDRDFLDGCVDSILNFDQRDLNLYSGGYSDFERQHAEQLAHRQALYVKQQHEIAHLEGFVRRFRAKASKAKQAQSRLKALSKMETLAAVQVDSPFQFHFPKPDRQPNPLIRIDGSAVGYGSENILSNVQFSLEPGSRVGLLGRNGAGKSTLIKLVADLLQPRDGRVERGHGLNIGYFAQHHLEQLRDDESPLEHLQRLDIKVREQELRNYLGSFGFVGDDATRAVAPFSGGEKSRLALALIIRQRPNLLLLDEPTNHLDLAMRNALTLALQEYDGAVVLVSHDRHLLNATTDQFLLVANGTVQPFDGDLNDYRIWLKQSLENSDSNENGGINSKKEQRQQAATQRQARSTQKKPLERRLRDIEKQMDKVHLKKDALDTLVADPLLYEAENKERLQKTLIEHADVTSQLETLESEWLEASDALESLLG